ncbi:TraB family protein [Candidatus Tiddalikarchaeum anstoanum]|nr:TraB family protein [Candidatus Tiddalikarchaeum anstoanum]
MDNIIGIISGGKDITLVGTAHVSRESRDSVHKIIEELKPDVVGVELCQKRFDSLTKPAMSDKNITNTISKSDFKHLIFQTLLTWYEQRIAKNVKVDVGSEMLEAIKIASKNNIPIALLDRDITATMSRLLNGLSTYEKVQLFFDIFRSLSDKVSEEDIEKLKEHNTVDALIDELGESSPVLKKVLLDERDEYIANQIGGIKEKKVVAFLGAAHIKGVKKILVEGVKEKIVININKKQSHSKLILPSIFVIILLLGFVKSLQTLISMIFYWAVATMSGAFLGGLLSLSNPLSILLGVLFAPILFVIDNAVYSSKVESSMRKVKESDLLRLGDIVSVKGIYSNNLTRILLTFSAVKIMTVAGLIIGLISMASLLM